MRPCPFPAIRLSNFPSFLISVAALTLAAPSSHATTCIDYADHMHFLGAVGVGGWGNDLAVSGNYAYVAVTQEFGASLEVIDVSDPESPALVSLLQFINCQSAVGIAIKENIAYVATGGFLMARGLQVVDVSNPAAPFLVRSLLGPCFDVWVAGSHAYVVQNMRLLVMDITDPRNPVQLGSVAAHGQAVSSAGDHAYVVDESAGLKIVDVSNPAAPMIAAVLPIPGAAQDVAVAGDHAFVASSDSGLVVVDVSIPAEPVIAGMLRGTSPQTTGVAVAEGNAFIVGASVLQAVDVSDPAAPVLVGRVSIGPVRRVHVGEGRAYVAGLGALAIADVTSPTSPAILGSLEMETAPRGIAVRENLALLVDDTGLELIDVTDSSTPVLAGQVPLADAQKTAPFGEYALVAGATDGLVVVDVHDPTHASVIATLDTPGRAVDVEAVGDVAFVADQNAGLRLVGLSDPAAPVTLSVVPVNANAVAAAGRFAYVFGLEAIVVVDVLDPTAPVILGSVPVSSTGGLDVEGGHLFVAETFAGLAVIDVGNPATPVRVATVSTPGPAQDVSVHDGVAYVVGWFPNFMHAVDVSVPESPTVIGGHYEFNAPIGVTADGGRVFVADETFGLRVIPGQCPGGTGFPLGAEVTRRAPRLGVHPNPFRSSALLDVTLTSPGDVTLRVFDASGRHVRQLLNGALPAGVTAARWDGRNERGDPVGSGVYFLRLEWSGGALSRRIAVVR